jgi:hypothetical protein
VLHAEWVAKAVIARKHILLEKPVARTAAELNAMLEECQEHAVALMPHAPPPFLGASLLGLVLPECDVTSQRIVSDGMAKRPTLPLWTASCLATGWGPLM